MTRPLHRREFLALAGAAGASLALPSLLRGQATAKDKRPNVLFIAVDDLNDWIGCMGGHPDTLTPNLDRLAARGVLFTNAHCSAPACNPSRTALLSGRRPSSSGVYNNYQPMRVPMPDVQTLPQTFRKAGYYVSGGGKIFHGRFTDPQSWDDYFDQPRDPRPPRKERPLRGYGKPRTNFDWGPIDVKDEDMGDAKVAAWAEKQLARRRDKPFFLGVGIYRPHLPWYVPKKYFDRFDREKITLPNVKEGDLDDVPQAGKKMARPHGDHQGVTRHNQWRAAVHGYLACVNFADAMVGRVIDALDRSPHADNTVIVLWGDHGWHLGEKLHWRKFALWEEATHCPLMVVAPGVTRPNGKSPRTVSLQDIYPTLTSLCGIETPDHVEGHDLTGLLKNPEAQWDTPALITWLEGNHSVRSERWRYIRYSGGGEELYDHEADPMEWTNLAGEAKYAGVKRDLAARLPEVDAPTAPTLTRKERRRWNKDKEALLKEMREEWGKRLD